MAQSEPLEDLGEFSHQSVINKLLQIFLSSSMRGMQGKDESDLFAMIVGGYLQTENITRDGSCERLFLSVEFCSQKDP